MQPRAANPRLTRRAFLAVAAVAVGATAGLAGIAGAAPSLQRPEDQRVALGSLTVAVHSDPWRLSLLAPDGQTVVWEEAPNEPLGFRSVEGMAYHATRLASSILIDADTLRLVAETDDPAGATISVEFQKLTPTALRMSITPDGGARAAAIAGSVSSPADERFVGFGECFDGVDQRGRKLEVWAEDRRVAGYGASSYAPIPLLLSSRGHSFALERFERSHFDLAASQPDRWAWQQDAPAASALIAYGPSLKDLVAQNAQLTGLAPLPPIWLFGVWKTSVGGQDEVISEMRRLRDLQIPVSAVFSYDAVDSDANLGWPNVTFAGRHAGAYPDPRAYTDALHGLGFKVLDYFTADFHVDRPNITEPATHGFLVRRQDGRQYVHDLFQISWLDFTDPDAVEWWRASWRRALGELGFDGGMLDLGELIPADAAFADGTTGLQTHNRYPLLYAQSGWQNASAVRPDGDFAVLLRSGALGAQRFQSAQWNGDAVMRWPGPDGLQSMLPAGLSFGLSGFPFWHAEVAGYVQADLDHDQERELWLRWLQLATWTSLLRDHLGDHPRSPVDVWLDDGTLNAYRTAARVHAGLVPYLYSLAIESSRTGLPIMRYWPLEVPDDPRAWDQQQSYFLGPTFLVAPVLEPGVTSRTVYLPGGEWVDYWRGTVYTGGQEVSVPAPIDGDGPPVFARAGSIVPLAAEHDSLVAADPSSGVRTWTGDLVVRIMPAGPTESTFNLYDGTRLSWTGQALRVESNPQPRQVELRTADGRVTLGRVDGTSGVIG